MSPNAGPPPVKPAPSRKASSAAENYLTVVNTLKGNSGAEARAVRAMFGGNKQLMDRFLAVSFSLLAADSNLLAEATPMSIIESIKQAARLGLEPMTEEAAIVVYGDQAKLLPMYQGYLKRIRNSGLVRAVDCGIVYTEDEFDYGTNENGWWHTHHPAKARRSEEGDRLSSRGSYMGAYAFAVMNNGYHYGRYMDVDEINYVRDTWGNTRSRNNRPLPWETSWPAMAMKTVVRVLRKMLPAEAVGREFIQLEESNDEAVHALTAEVRRNDESLAEVRNLALRAVGALESGEDEKQSEATDGEQKEQPASEDDPTVQHEPTTVDPNVAAAMQLNAEQQEQLKRQRGR